MAVQNGTFEEPGAGPWLAAGWHRRGRRTTSGVLAGFAAGETFPLQDGLDFTSAEWAREGVTVAPDAGAGPDGSAVADALVEETGDTPHRLLLAEGRTFRPGSTYTFGLYVRDDGRPYATLGLPTTVGTVVAVFDLTAAAIFSPPSPFGEVVGVNAGCLEERGGWRRVEVSFRVSSVLVAAPWLAPAADGAAYPGDPPRGLLLWGAYLYSGAARGAEDHGAGWSANELSGPTAAAREDAPFETGVADPATWPIEDHERGWGKLKVTPSRGQALFGLTTGANLNQEGHERDWPAGQAPYYTAGAGVTALFSSGVYPREAHDFAWDNASHPFNIVSGPLAAFDEGAGEFDGHERAFADFQYALDSALEALVSPGHGRSVGDTLHLYAQYGGVIPEVAGVTEQIRLHVVEATADELKVASTPLGPPLAFADAGVGQQFARADPKRFWSGGDVSG